MTEDLDRRLRGLVDEIEPAVVISPASAARKRGGKRRTRSRVTAAVATVAAVGAIATGVVVLGNPDGAGRTAAPGPATSAPGCPSPSIIAVTDPAPADIDGDGDIDVYCRPGGGPKGTQGPLSPRAVPLAELPATTDGAAWKDTRVPGTWTGTQSENGISGSVFCLPVLSASPDRPGVPNAGVPGDTPIERTGYDIAVGDGRMSEKGVLNEVVLTLKDEQTAASVVAAFDASMATCQARQPGSTVTRVGGPDTAQLWKWDAGPNSYRGYQAYGRKGNVVVILGYLEYPPEFLTEFTPQFVQSAVDRAAG